MLDDNWLTSNSSDFSVVKVVIVISVFLLLQSIVKYISSLFEKGRSDRDTNEFPEEQQPPIVRSLIDHGRKQRDSFEKHQTVEMERLSKLLEDKDKLLQQKDINIEMIREDYKGKIRQVTECHNKEQQVLREHLEDLKRMKESAEQKCQEDRDCHLAEKNNWKSEKNKMKIVGAPWYVPNQVIAADLEVESVKEALIRMSESYIDRLIFHTNQLAKVLMATPSGDPNRLKRFTPLELLKRF
ncbi:hypothetical protein DMENIID0001_059360 [Sergentomyia squamirostris]